MAATIVHHVCTMSTANRTKRFPASRYRCTKEFGTTRAMARTRRIIKEYPGPAAELLASLRERADLSVTELSHLVNLKRSNYHYYERGFKGKYLPLWLVVDVMGALMPRGVPADDILKLLPELIRAVMRQELADVQGKLDEVMDILRHMRSEYGEQPVGEGKPPRQH